MKSRLRFALRDSVCFTVWPAALALTLASLCCPLLTADPGDANRAATNAFPPTFNAADSSEPFTRGADPLDVESTRRIREYTTETKYLTAWVDHLPASTTVLTPSKFLGYVVGMPGKLTRPERIHEYFRALDAASERVQVFSMGPTDLGREMILVAIADAEVLVRLDQITAANRELADPRATTEARAVELARSTPPLYWITAGLHSTETGSPEMVMELAYRLAVSEQDHIRAIRKNIVTLITPVMEVDGRAQVVDWYERFLTKATDWEDMPPRSPPYWGKYTFHDNNRDGLQQSQLLTRTFTDTFFRYLPVVSLDLHESVPLMYVSTGTGPYNETIDPIATNEWQWMASYDLTQTTKLGLQGIWTWGFYDGWYPGYLLWVTNNHNAIGRFYETFGNSHPGTFRRKLRSAMFAERRVDSRQWYRPWPPDTEVVWSLRNNINYTQTGVLASLELASRHGDTLLYNFWKKGQNSLDAGRTQPPHAFHIPAQQRDRATLHHLLWLLSRHRIEVHTAEADTVFGKTAKVRRGDFIVRLDQPYRNLAKTLLVKADYPKTATLAAYDDVAWSLDLMLGVEIHPISEKSVFALKVAPLTTVPPLPGTVTAGRRWLVEHRGQAALASLCWRLPPNAKVRALSQEWSGHPAGSLLIENVASDPLESACRDLHLDALALEKEPEVRLVAVDLPRVALFHTWVYTQDSGWARYTLEQLGIPYTLINKDHLRAGSLHERFDVILVPSLGGMPFARMVHEIDPKWGPMPYTKTPAFASHGEIDSSEDITRGMGFEGLANLNLFVRGGGLLVNLGSAGRLASEGGLTLEVTTQAPTGTPGSHLTAKVLRPEHPVVWGYPEATWLFRGNLPLYSVRDHFRGFTLLQFGMKTLAAAEKEADRKADIPVPEEPSAQETGTTADADGKGQPRKIESTAVESDPKADKPKEPPLLRSGLLKAPEAIETKAALLDVPVGRGHVLFYSWNPMHRYQNHHDFAFVTNALLFFNDLPQDYPSEEEMRRREVKAVPGKGAEPKRASFQAGRRDP